MLLKDDCRCPSESGRKHEMSSAIAPWLAVLSASRSEGARARAPGRGTCASTRASIPPQHGSDQRARLFRSIAGRRGLSLAAGMFSFFFPFLAAVILELPTEVYCLYPRTPPEPWSGAQHARAPGAPWARRECVHVRERGLRLGPFEGLTQAGHVQDDQVPRAYTGSPEGEKEDVEEGNRGTLFHLHFHTGYPRACGPRTPWMAARLPSFSLPLSAAG